MTDEQLTDAIAVVNESRQTHVAWLEYFEAAATSCQAAGCGRDHSADRTLVGDEAHHRQCIAGYDRVITTLEAASADLRESRAREAELVRQIDRLNDAWRTADEVAQLVSAEFDGLQQRIDKALAIYGNAGSLDNCVALMVAALTGTEDTDHG